MNKHSRRPAKTNPKSQQKLSDPKRRDGRTNNQMRAISFEPNFIIHPEGSVLVSVGKTRVLCNVSVEDGAPSWLARQGKSGGWVTAEYSMLPRATHTRSQRESRGPSGRTQEIQRLIGRSLRSMVNLNALGSRTCTIDCDVLQADGGTRTASINGACVALTIALQNLIKRGVIPKETIKCSVAAISVGLVDGKAMLDLCYEEDSHADVDMNVVMTSRGEFIEIQGTGESRSFPRTALNNMLDLAEKGIKEILAQQQLASKRSAGRSDI